MNNQPKWMLQTYWCGGWRNLFGSNERRDLLEYANSCPKNLQFRIIDTTDEEVKKHGRRRDKPV